MKINLISELENLFKEYPCSFEIGDESFIKFRVVSENIYESFISYELNFWPYVQIAQKCSMSYIDIMRSPKTNRFYIGFTNLAGHAPRCEVRPVKLSQVKNHWYMESLFANYCELLGRGIDSNEYEF